MRALQEWITLLEQHRKDMLDQIQKAIEELQRKVPAFLVRSVTVVHCARALRDALIEHRGATEEVGRLQQELDAIERWRSFISEAAREFAEAEADLVRRKIDMLQDDIRAIFRDIWAGSEIVPKLRRDDRNQRLYLMLERFFSAQDLDAVPVLSESARNALALSIFLAASKRRQFGGRFLVLDDVTSSFDAGHQTRLIEAIRTHIARPHVPDGLQVILLTYDGMLEKLFDQAVSNGWAWTGYKLHGTPPEGLVKD
ncbi:hypothetical protein [Thermaerobacter subterraneus]|uniref:hypothetical protein n=1 Tax=Thermaerobacter subterraneus TaxID=175696 RepID=UPI0012EA50E2|nr:hypothetical protein [Thermaerobacter subterraneus]